MPRWYTELSGPGRRQNPAPCGFFRSSGSTLRHRFRPGRDQIPACPFGRAGGAGRAGRADRRRASAFTGYGTAHLESRLAVGPDVLRHYAGFFAARPRSSSRLASMVSDYLGRPVEVREFAGAWLPIAPDQQSRLPRGRVPGAFCELGVNAAIGTRAWDQQARFIVRIGPLSRSEFEALLPDKKRLPALVSLIRAYVGWEADFAINLVLDAPQIPTLSLGGGQADAPRLGWTSLATSSTATIRGRAYADETMFSAETVEKLCVSSLN